jgi:hypothetical protein
MRELVESWMSIIRPTHWNGQEIRCPLPIGDISADSYQRTAEASFFRSRFVVLEVWYCSVSALSGFLITFLLLQLLIAVPIGSNLDLGVTFTFLTVFDAVGSVFAGVMALFAVLDRGSRVFYRCHFRLEFGSPDMPLTPADYGKSLGQVYQDLFSGLVRWEPCMISLILDVDKDTFSDSPSWVPNWNALGKSLAQPEYILNSE